MVLDQPHQKPNSQPGGICHTRVAHALCWPLVEASAGVDILGIGEMHKAIALCSAHFSHVAGTCHIGPDALKPRILVSSVTGV